MQIEGKLDIFAEQGVKWANLEATVSKAPLKISKAPSSVNNKK